jgi:hypothetical protein
MSEISGSTRYTSSNESPRVSVPTTCVPVVPNQSVYKCLSKSSTLRDTFPVDLGLDYIVSYSATLRRVSQKTGSGS